MSISANIFNMSQQEYEQFVSLRRQLRTAGAAASIQGKKQRKKTVSQLAKELGVDKNVVIDMLEKGVI